MWVRGTQKVVTCRSLIAVNWNEAATGALELIRQVEESLRESGRVISVMRCRAVAHHGGVPNRIGTGRRGNLRGEHCLKLSPDLSF
jgi:hypothetical protein